MNQIMYPFLFTLIYKFNCIAINYIFCDGKRAIEAKEKKYYRSLIEALTRLESTLLSYTEFSSSTTINKIQLSKMRRLLATVSEVPFWEEYTHQYFSSPNGFLNMSDITKFPILTRKDIQMHFNEGNMLNPSIPLQRKVFATTSGSTGEPLAFYLDTLMISGRRSCHRRMVKWFSPIRSILTVKAMQIINHGFVNFPGVLSFKFRNNQNINISLADLYLFIRNRLRNNLNKILIDTLPSNVMRFVRMMEDAKLDGSRILGFISGGETLLPGEREYVKKVLGCDVRSYYASTEMEVIASECGKSPEHAYHMHSEYFYVEIVDMAGKPVSLGMLGRVLITSFDNYVMPFIRYDTGDFGRFVTESCPCGRTLPLLVVEGRQAHLITLPSGKTFTQFSLIGVFYNDEIVSYVRQFQIVHEAPTRVTINMILNTAQDPRLDNFLRLELRKIFNNEVSVSFVVLEHIPAMKNGKRMGYISLNNLA